MTWIQFNEPKVKAYLEKNGTVYTVRHYPAKAPFIRGVRQGSNFLGFKVVRGRVNLTKDGFCESEWIKRNHEWVPSESLVETAEQTKLLEIYKRAEHGFRIRE